MVTTFGKRAFKKVTTVKWDYQVGVLIQQDCVLLRRRAMEALFLHTHADERSCEDVVREGAAADKAGRELSQKPANSDGTLIWIPASRTVRK